MSNSRTAWWRALGLACAGLAASLGSGLARADDAPPPAPAAPAAPALPSTGAPGDTAPPPASPVPPPPGGVPSAPPAAAPVPSLPPPQGEERRISLAEALRLGAARNLELLAGAYDPRIADRGIDAADGAFDTLLTAGFEGGRRETPSNVSFLGTDVTREDFAGVNAGVARQLRNGGRLSAVFTADRLRSNSAVVERNPAWTSGVTVEYAQPLLRGAGDVAMADVRRARSAARAADHAFDALTDDVLLQIETAYWELAFAHAQWAARRKAEDVAENLLSVTQTRYDARVATVLDLADARAGLEARRGDRLFVDGGLRKAEDALRALVLPFDGGPGPGPRLVPTDDPVAIPASDRLDPRDVERYVTQAVRGRPDLLAARAALDARDVDVDVARSDLLPQLDLVARLSVDGLDGTLGGALEETFGGQATTGTLGLNFSLYLGRRSAQAKLCIAQWSRSQAAVRVREQENRVVLEVRAALHDLATAQARRGTAGGEIAAAREALEGEVRKEQNGESTPFRVLEKEDAVTQAVTRENRASMDIRIATARLWKAIGMLRDARGIPRPAAAE
jgi:outer membrane protein TolC